MTDNPPTSARRPETMGRRHSPNLARKRKRGPNSHGLSITGETQGYFPAGGGIYGSDPAAENLNLGYPSQNAILKLARPIVLPVRQNFFVNCAFFPIGSTDIRTTLNAGATDDQKVVMVVLDGLDIAEEFPQKGLLAA